jgi:hypothetical protein
MAQRGVLASHDKIIKFFGEAGKETECNYNREWYTNSPEDPVTPMLILWPVNVHITAYQNFVDPGS